MLCACGDDIALRVAVEHPAGSNVVLTTVTVYESAIVSCIDISFGRIGANELDALEVTRQSIASDGTEIGELTGISRVDHKIIVARGFDGEGAWITAGCAEHDVVDERTKITIATVPTVTASPVLDTNTSDPFLAILAISDSRGRAVTDRAVAWSVYGPAGSKPQSMTNVAMPSDGVWEPTKATCTGPNGAARVHPPPPNVIGGYAVQLTAQWAIDLPALYSRFVASFGDRMLSPPNQSKKYCAIRKKGPVARVVCLDGNFARDFEVMVSGGTVSLVQRDMTPIGAEAMNVVAVHNGNDRDVYMMSTRGILFPLFGAAMPDNSAAPCSDGSCQVDDVLAVPPCGSIAGKLLVKVRGGGAGQIKQLSSRGGGMQDFPLGMIAPTNVVQLDNGGCVTRVDPTGGPPTLRQVVTYHVGGLNALSELVIGTTRAVYNCAGASCMANELFPGAGAAFTDGDEPRMLATFVDASGVVIAEVVLAPDDANRDLFIERSRSPAAGIPDRMVVGQYDADSQLDLFWNISARRGATFEVAYAREVAGQRLEALSPAQPITVTALDSLDLTGDGFDDVMVIGDRIASVGAGVIVIPANAPAPPLSVPSDSTCTP
jgi:hypothetical protein